jgi:hypothetical protein
VAKNRKNQPKPLSQQIHQEALAKRLEYVEAVLRLVLPDLRNLADSQNFQGAALQATINVLGPGPVGEEMKRLQQEQQGQTVGQAPVAEAEQATVEEALIEAAKIVAAENVDANGTPVDGNQA